MVAAYLLLLRATITRGRVFALAGLGSVAILLGIALRVADEGNIAYGPLVEGFGMTLLVPVVSLAFASAALGDPAEDRWLVHLWLTPAPRWKIALAALGASLTIALPVGALPVVIAAAVAGAPSKVITGAAAGATLAVLGYCSVFVPLGLRVRRALAWGLAYLLIWELAVARVARGAARVSISVHVRSLLAEIADAAPPRNAVAASTALIALAVTLVLGFAVTTWWLHRTDVA